MIGENIEFYTEETEWVGYNHQFKKSEGKVLDKISEIHGHVARGWAISKGSNNVAVNQTRTYYMVADNEGKIHRVTPNNILRTIQP